jgi:predicted GIY-YIG superfamily endonuclease
MGNRKDNYVIYGLYNENNLFYIGITCNPKTRLATHKKRFGSHILLKELYEISVRDKGFWGSSAIAQKIETALIIKLINSGVKLENKHSHCKYSNWHIGVANKIYKTL